eukprot:TRINITY_DN2986_c0_g1_i6.p1 TRINITY_DN2986_c0_g1~~TRINITY_DN2986_c0_g1_i6.p1  ORF type:complete len:268 (-),score=66.44 TRINITY_DN2986_c0_g1_i6:135-938(-)
MSKHCRDARVGIANSGGIPPLVSLLSSRVYPAARHAALALLNIALEKELKEKIVMAGAAEALVNLLKGSKYCSDEQDWLSLRESAVGALCCLSSCSVDNRPAIIATDSSTQMRRDCLIALFNLSMDATIRQKLVETSIIQNLIEWMEEEDDGFGSWAPNPREPECAVENEMVALLANLCKCDQGRKEVVSQRGISVLASVVETGRRLSQSNAVSALLLLTTDRQMGESCQRVLKKEGILPALSAFAQIAAPRCKEKAARLMELLRTA